MNAFKIPVSIALLSAAIIAFQLSLIQILSIVQWYHFAYMVISVALLGFGDMNVGGGMGGSTS